MNKKFARFSYAGSTHIGIVDGDVMRVIEHASFPTLDAIVAANAFEAAATATHRTLPVREVVFLPPMTSPQKIICVGVNFPDRNEEYKDGNAAPNNPSLFIRFPSSFTGHNQPLIRPPESHQLDYEGEIAIIIGKAGRRISEADALDHISALTLCNEGTLRDWVRHAKFNVTQGKNFERSGSMGPWLLPFRDERQIADIQLTTRVNGQARQSDRTSRMIFSFRKIIAYISTFTTLEPGDIVVTGTPTGAGARLDPPQWLKPGDVIEVEADGLGILRNTVEDES
jgi:2-keto-4-pentenoate hydratase/2-oxohepta-3-ene-1,7-dioic acid hydratase in catechol pathway